MERDITFAASDASLVVAYSATTDDNLRFIADQVELQRDGFCASTIRNRCRTVLSRILKGIAGQVCQGV